MPLTRGQRLRRLRAQKGVEQQEAAPAIGISRPYLSLLERDEKGRNVDHLRTTFEKAAGYYGVIPEYLLAETPQEYIQAYARSLGSEAPATSGGRLKLVLDELQLRWGEEFATDRVAQAMGTQVDVLGDFLDNRVQITDSAAQQFQEVTGAPVDWLVPRQVVGEDRSPEIQRIVQMAMKNGVEPADLEMMIQLWLAAKNTKTPSGQ